MNRSETKLSTSVYVDGNGNAQIRNLDDTDGLVKIVEAAIKRIAINHLEQLLDRAAAMQNEATAMSKTVLDKLTELRRS